MYVININIRRSKAHAGPRSAVGSTSDSRVRVPGLDTGLDTFVFPLCKVKKGNCQLLANIWALSAG